MARKNLTATSLSLTPKMLFTQFKKESVRFSTTFVSLQPKHSSSPSPPNGTEHRNQASSVLVLRFRLNKTFRLGSPVFFIRKSFHNFVPPVTEKRERGHGKEGLFEIYYGLLSYIFSEKFRNAFRKSVFVTAHLCMQPSNNCFSRFFSNPQPSPPLYEEGQWGVIS